MLVAHQHGVFARQVLGVAATSCYSMNVQAGAEDDVRALAPEFSGGGSSEGRNA